MKIWKSLLGLVLFAGVSLGLQTESGVAKLVRDLGSSSFEEREKATRDLEAQGEKALVELKKASASEDAEVRRRAEDLVRKIESQLENQRLTRPTLVQLNHKEAPLENVLADLFKQSGFRVILQDRAGTAAKKKVTVQTSRIPFWEALEQVCLAGGLVEIAVPLNGIEVMPELIEFEIGPLPVQPRIAPVQPRRIVPPPQKEEQGNRRGVQAGAAVRVALIQGAVVQPVKEEKVPALPQAILPLPPVAGGIRGLPESRPGGMPLRAEVIVLRPGIVEPLPVDTRSAYRIRALKSPEKIFGKSASGKILLGLEVTPEPRLKLRNISRVLISKAVDDQGQILVHEASLTNAGDPVPPPLNGPGRIIIRPLPAIAMELADGQPRVPIFFSKAEKESKKIASLEGALVLEVLSEEQTCLEIVNLEKAGQGKVEGKLGGWIKLNEFKKEANGSHKVRFEWEIPPGVTPVNGEAAGAKVQRIFQGVPGPFPVPLPVQPKPAPAPKPKQGLAFQPAPVPAPLPLQVQVQLGNVEFATGNLAGSSHIQGFQVLDTAGNALRSTTSSSRFQQGPGGIIRELTLVFPKGTNPPASLVFKGRKSHTVEAPFALKDIPLGK
ncbi:MAG: hypothetical protein EXR99_11515 [Gemmataceae bacterium]|nr:hypothetical protein [Gemmataceae bacterium]